MNEVFMALKDKTRRAILVLLREDKMTAGDIAANFEMSKPSVSHHLDLLKRADLVHSEREGQYIYYTINTTVLEDVMQWIISLKSD